MNVVASCFGRTLLHNDYDSFSFRVNCSGLLQAVVSAGHKNYNQSYLPDD